MFANLHVTLPAAAVATAIPLLLWGLLGKGRRGKRGQEEAEEHRVVDEHQLRLQEGILSRVIRPVLHGLGRQIRRLTPAGWVTSLERRLRLAGSPARWPVERTLAVKLLLALGVILFGGLWVARFSPAGGIASSPVVRIGVVLLACFVAYRFPDLAISLRGKDRQLAIQTALPDALDQMSISVEAGLGFDASLGRVVDTGEGPLVDELHRTLQEISIGVPRKQAFHNLVERTDVAELRHFVFAVNQAEQYGLPIAQVLRVQSKELRMIRRQRAEERALKIPVKIVFPLVLCIFPSLFVVLLVPAAIRIFEALSR